MLFSDTVFLFIFLPALLIVYFNPFCRSIRFRNGVLILFSLAFYAWGEPLFVFVMILSSLVNWLVGLLIERRPKAGTALMTVGIVYDLGILFVFKYLSFVTENIALLTGNESVIVDLALPLGISFFTFQMISYIIDVKRGGAKAQPNPLYVLLYIAMFPQLIAGPIVRYSTVEKEITGRTHLPKEFTDGFCRFVFGLGKKVLLSNYLGLVADSLMDTTSPISVASAWLGAICYSLQLFFDFSGYSDMAIGLGLIFGFHFPENFNYPYTAGSITTFWRKWHISLSAWFRDYVYIPLGGSRVGKKRLILNLFVVWLLTGIWHGANWTFVVWGLGYFVLLAAEKLIGWEKIERLPVIGHIYTLFFVVLLWVVFRQDTLPEAMTYIGTMFGIGASALVDADFLSYVSGIKWVLLASVLLSFPVCKWASKKLPGKLVPYLKAVGVIAVFVLSILACSKATYTPFIYFNF